MTPSHSLIAGFDAAYSRDGKIQSGVWAVWSVQEKHLVDWTGGRRADPPPYIPGRFYLRECGLAVDLLLKLKARPDLLLFDGHGQAHPEGHGLACHIGGQAGLPTIGVAKELLCGKVGTLGAERGSTTPILLDGRTIGVHPDDPLFLNAMLKPPFIMNLRYFRNPIRLTCQACRPIVHTILVMKGGEL